MTTETMKKIVQARANLVLDEPFFGTLALRLAPRPDPSCGTFWTEGKQLGFDPAYVESLSIAEVQGVICHEILHVANGHPWRRDGRDKTRWNAACDYAINPIVTEARMVLPKGGLQDPSYAGLSAEQIYARLNPPPPSSEQEGEDQGESGSGSSREQQQADYGCGEVRDDLTDEATANEADWQVATLQAAQAALAQGKLPASLKRLVDEIRRSRVDWRAALRRFVQQCAREDYSWRFPNRRFVPAGLYLPELRSETMPPLIVAVDTSGSIGQETLNDFAAELMAIMDECAPEALRVIYCDAKIQHMDEFQRGDTITLHPQGGGGTDFRPVFERVEHEGEPPACLIYLTDLMGTFPAEVPEYPVLWVSTTEHFAPFGETLRIEL